MLRLKKKDPEAFSKIYDIYVTPIYRFIYFKVSSKQDAEDLTSEVFMKIWQYVTETEDEIENLRALIYRSARNLVIDFYRKNARKDLIQDEELMAGIEDEKQQSLLESIDNKIEMQNVENILRQMKDDYREIIILRFIEELSIGEIAKILNKSKGSVRVTLHRALKIARDLSSKNEQQSQ